MTCSVIPHCLIFIAVWNQHNYEYKHNDKDLFILLWFLYFELYLVNVDTVGY